MATRLDNDFQFIDVGRQDPSKKDARKRAKMGKDTVCSKFKAQLAALLDEIERTAVQYVRCVKPNTRKSPAYYDAPMVVDPERGVYPPRDRRIRVRVRVRGFDERRDYRTYHIAVRA